MSTSSSSSSKKPATSVPKVEAQPAKKRIRTCQTKAPPVPPSFQEVCELVALIVGTLRGIHGECARLGHVIQAIKEATQVTSITEYGPSQSDLVKFLECEDLDKAERESKLPRSILVAVIAEAINRSACLAHTCINVSLIGGALCDIVPKWVAFHQEMGIDVLTGSSVVPGTFNLTADFIDFVKKSILKMYKRDKKDEDAVPHRVAWAFVEKVLSGMCEKKDDEGGEEEEEEDEEEEYSVENKPPLPPVILPNINIE